MIPSLSESAATPGLVTARWATFLSIMLAMGLFSFRMLIARPGRGRRAAGDASALDRLRHLPLAALIAPDPPGGVDRQLRAAVVYDFHADRPLVRASALGRAQLDLEILLALFGLAAPVAIPIDRGIGARSIAELLAMVGAVLAGGAMLAVPGWQGTRRRPRRRRFR